MHQIPPDRLDARVYSDAHACSFPPGPAVSIFRYFCPFHCSVANRASGAAANHKPQGRPASAVEDVNPLDADLPPQSPGITLHARTLYGSRHHLPDEVFHTGVIDVNGAVRNVLPGEAPAFAVGPPRWRRVTPPLRQPGNQWGNAADVLLIKNTRLRERWDLQLRVAAFNAFNTPVVSSDPNLDRASANSGRIFRDDGQNNFPRDVRPGLRLAF